LYSALYYPSDYGIVPRTWSPRRSAGHSGVDYEAYISRLHNVVRPIGVLTTEDESGEDSKILGVPVVDPRFQEVTDVKDVAKHLKAEIEDFFLSYKRLEPRKWVKVKGWKDARTAGKMILLAIRLYKEKFDERI